MVVFKTSVLLFFRQNIWLIPILQQQTIYNTFQDHGKTDTMLRADLDIG